MRRRWRTSGLWPKSMRPMAVASKVEAAGLRILDGIVGRTDGAGRPWGEGLKWLAKHLVGGAAGQRERRDCE
jgi:hypothetical protein